MELFGKATLADVVGDLVVFRNLDIQDRRIPGLRNAWKEMDLPSRRIPRKHEDGYARAAAWFLTQARRLDRSTARINEVLFLGDTALSDGGAFRNIRREGGWKGWAFIGTGVSENTTGAPEWNQDETNVTQGGRWNLLARWIQEISAQGAACDERTAVVIDMDKTLIGARGRNSVVIDAARLDGLRTTMVELLGSSFNQDVFEEAYQALNQPRFHRFTADNQDYLAYVCLIISSGVISLPGLMECLAEDPNYAFMQFVRWADTRLNAKNVELADMHYSFYKRLEADDPTPFKTFRRREYVATVSRMGNLPDEASIQERLSQEICLTREVMEVADWLKKRGAVVLVLSDKPDEASLPTPEQVREGFKPLHRVSTHVVGETIASQLP